MAKSTRISNPTKTIAWPSCRRRCRDLVAVLGTVNRISSNDDSVADNLLDYWRERLKIIPERHFYRLIANRGLDVEATWTGCRKSAEPAAGAVRNYRGLSRNIETIPVACRAGVGDEDPAGVGWRQLRRALRVAAIGDGPVGARVGEDLGHRVHLHCRSHVGVGRPAVHIARRRASDAVRVDEVGGASRHPGALIGGLLQRDVEVKPAPEVDDPEREKQQDRCDDRELGHAL